MAPIDNSARQQVEDMETGRVATIIRKNDDRRPRHKDEAQGEFIRALLSRRLAIIQK